jgi:hypothetical protein
MRYTPPADHYLQLDILRKLYTATAPLNFTSLKDDGIDNSLFMYHMNKLIARNIVQKSEDGFMLTKAGAVWLNATGIDSLTPLMYPKVLVHLLVTCGDSVLTGKREGAPATLLNNFLLPGTAARMGTPLTVAANNYATSLGIYTAVTYTGQYEHIQENSDFLYHSIGFVYAVALETKPEILSPSEHYSYQWLAIDEAIGLQNEPLLTSVLSTYLDEGSFNQLRIISKEAF